MEKISVLLDFLLGLSTLIAGGGWFVYYKQNKRKKHIEITNEEYNGDKQMLENTVESLNIFERVQGLLEKQTADLAIGIGNHAAQHKKLEDGIDFLKVNLKTLNDDVKNIKKEIHKIKTVKN